MRFKSLKSMTLVEVMVTCAIMVMMLSMISVAIVEARSSFRITNEFTLLQNQMRNAAMIVFKELSMGRNVTVYDFGGKKAVKYNAIQDWVLYNCTVSNCTEWEDNKPGKIIESGNEIVDYSSLWTADNTAIYLDNTTLRRAVNGIDVGVVATDVQAHNFTEIPLYTDEFRFELNLTRTDYTGRQYKLNSASIIKVRNNE